MINFENEEWIYCDINGYIVSLCFGFAVQSSGKSSVLESIVGKDFLPRGSGKILLLICEGSVWSIGRSYLFHSLAMLAILLYVDVLIYAKWHMGKWLQVLLLGVLLCCSYIRLMKAAENMQSFSISRGKGSLILVNSYSFSDFAHLDLICYVPMLFIFYWYPY